MSSGAHRVGFEVPIIRHPSGDVWDGNSQPLATRQYVLDLIAGFGGGGAAPGVVHTQANASASWTIAHTFPREPLVQVLINDELVLADVEHSDGLVSVIFPTPTTGKAVLL